jgi:hypothetical protein
LLRRSNKRANGANRPDGLVVLANLGDEAGKRALAIPPDAENIRRDLTRTIPMQ